MNKTIKVESKVSTPVELKKNEEHPLLETNYIKFKKLTPITNSKIHTYEEGLDFVFAHEDIKNVAITGPYGAGKTSLINTYKELNPEKIFLNISLALFQPEKNESSIKDESKTSEEEEPIKAKSEQPLEDNILEAKILNQLLHQIDSKKIPKTNFKIKEKIPQKRIVWNTILVLMLGLSILFFIFYNSWITFIPKLSNNMILGIANVSTVPEVKLAVGVTSILIVSKFIYDLFVIQNNRNIFKKLNLQGNQIEILEESDDSYFDKYLNEVLYIFENSGADAIIFEDIDRYNANQIFGKLREINTLINNKKKKNDNKKQNNKLVSFFYKHNPKVSAFIERKTKLFFKKDEFNNFDKPLRFIYSLRDDVFVSKDRTKFFDFILPVVPVLDGSNSYEQFLREFEDEVKEKTLDTQFLQGVSLYVDDMRILKNIYNEFLVYKKRLDTIELDLNKLLALVTYKNIFPRDFGELQLSAGFVYNLFNEKPNFLKEEIATIERQICEKQNLLTEIHNEKLNSIEELDAIYFHIPHILKSVKGQSIEKYERRIDLIKAIRENPASVVVVDGRYAQNIRSMDVSQFLSDMESNPEYSERKKLIQDKTFLEDERISLELQQLKKEKQLLSKNKLQNIINKSNIDSIFKSKHTNELGINNYFKEIRSSPYFPLIKYLIRNGYIDETYPDYMTYFYATSLTIEDKIFLRSISDEEAKDPNYHLKNLELIVSRLDAADFQRSEILNYELLEYLLSTSDSNLVYLETFIKQLEESKNFTFIEGFLGLETHTKIFISILNSIWPHFFLEVISISNYDELLKKEISLALLNYSSVDELNHINKDSQLETYISNNEGFLNLENPDINKITEKLDLLNVRFKDLNFEISHTELLKEVYEMKLFELNFLLICKFLKHIYLIESDTSLTHKNYSLIRTKKNESLYDYVNNNIQEYLEVVLENCEEKITDEEPAILELLNNQNVEFDTKIKYINFLVNKVKDLNEIKDIGSWPTALAHGIILNEPSNVTSYFFKNENGLDSYLVDFINEFELGLSFEPDFLNANFGEDAAESFYDAVIQANTLANKQYKSILSSFDWHYDEFEIEGVESEKVSILIDLGIISMSEENLTFLRERYDELKEQFIIKNIDDYLELLNPEIYRLDEALFLLESSISIPQKLIVLKHNDSEISLRERELATEIKGYIIENHFDLKDFQFLLDNYSNEKRQIQEKIIKLISEQFSYVLKEKLSIPFNVLKEIYLHKQLSEQQNKQLLVLNLKDYVLNEAYELFATLNSKEYLSLFEGGRPKIPKTDIDKQLLDVLKSKNWISYSVDKNEPTYFRAISKKAIKRH
ncbi:hypothetical protein CXF91_05905 (plasmid) [Planococcus sp. Urea-3u-39]|uniref:YobI family P-loop NTPase n=3 Tax=unclassified Planococcus (in: firmicutes) TaxID=2662419 RepID=UPI000C7BE6CD|nr:hypothetical protein [Planococcus sp. Urea-3u-39]PKG89717.1 hypothetical protein CXF91_05905 [Planococcus sp. Urea-3u-39]